MTPSAGGRISLYGLPTGALEYWVHAESVGNATITVRATRALGFATTAGQGCEYTVTLELPDYEDEGRLALGSGTPGVVERTTWATVVEVTLLGVIPGTDSPYPGSRDQAPMQAARTRAWVDEHRTSLKERCETIRASSAGSDTW